MYSEQQHKVIVSLVACILRAERDCGPSSEAATSTRLKCLALANRAGIDGRHLMNFRENRDLGDWTINCTSRPYWADVAPPELLVQEIQES